MAGLDEGTPLFAQVAERLAAEIADGGLAEGDRVPSTNELAAYYRINPATAAKGINLLADDGLLEKRRGIGMFVADGARQRLLGQRREQFTERYPRPALTAAARAAPGAVPRALPAAAADRGAPAGHRRRRADRADLGLRLPAGRRHHG